MGLPAEFTGVMDVSSSTPFAALTTRSLCNERDDFLLATLPLADMTRSAPAPVVFPQIADGAGGVALVMISFPGAEIGRALRHAAGGLGSDAELRNSASFWEAAGRGFWILGGLRSILSIVIGFAGMATQKYAGLPAIIAFLIQSLLSAFYGSLLALICFVPCWKLMGRLPKPSSVADAERSETLTSAGPPRWRFGAVIGYALFLAALVSTVRLPNPLMVWAVHRPSLLVVLGGTLALLLFMGGNNAKLTPSAAFAGMGLIGSLMGFIQMLHGMTFPPLRVSVVLPGRWYSFSLPVSPRCWGWP